MSIETPVRPDLLETIVSATRRAVRDRETHRSMRDLEQARAGRSADGERFVEALRRGDGYNVIAECKRRSPSRGVIRPAYDPATIAESYAESGAAAISVLTEPAFFDGALEHLEAVRGVVEVPLLRKDFIVSEYQLFEACVAGANAVLLIVAALDDAALRRLMASARVLGLAVLTEVHGGDDLGRALHAGADVIGVNNRNLRTLSVDLHASEALIEDIPDDVVAVAESGLRVASDLVALRQAGYDAFLIGESFMSQAEPGAALAALLSEVERGGDARCGRVPKRSAV